MRIHDDIVRVLAALPAPVQTKDNIAPVIAQVLADRPDWYWSPITAAQCGAMLGVTTQALATARSRGKGPQCYKAIDGIGLRYNSRGEVLLEMRHLLDAPAPQLSTVLPFPMRRAG